MKQQTQIWNELFDTGELIWDEPHEWVVSLVPRLRERGVRRILDLGCGAGRHLIYLAEQGFDVYGTDISTSALHAARERLRQAGVTVPLLYSDMAALPFADDSFDALISLHVIHHGTAEDIRVVMGEIYRVLRAGGLALLNFLSTRSYSYGDGTEIAPNTFITESGTDTGIPHHFTDEAELDSFLADFTILNKEPLDYYYEDDRIHSHWTVVIEN